jgi:hypothetical protein
MSALAPSFAAQSVWSAGSIVLAAFKAFAVVGVMSVVACGSRYQL